MLLLLFAATASSAQPVKHVVLVTIDGMRPEFYLNKDYPAPTLRYLMQHGAYAKQAESVFPTVTYPNHTTIVTGALPARHGIYCNEPFEPEGITGRWFWQADSIKVPTLFDAVKAKGLTSAAVFWPVQIGSKVDYLIPDIWNTRTYDRLKPIAKNVKSAEFWQEVQQNATGILTTDDLNEGRFSLDENSTRMTAYFIRKYKPALTALHLICTDDQEHERGRDADSVKLALSSADHCIGQLLEAIERAGIKDSTVLIVTGDHGFADIKQTIFPNVWLSKAGLISGSNWKAKFHSGRGSGFLVLKYPRDTETLKAARKALTSLPTDKRKLFKLIEKSELDKLGAYPNAALAIVPADGVSVGAEEYGSDIRPAGQKGTHGYLPSDPKMKTGFIVYGPGIKGVVLDTMRLVDIAPLIAKLLDLDFKAPDGHLVKALLN